MALSFILAHDINSSILLSRQDVHVAVWRRLVTSSMWLLNGANLCTDGNLIHPTVCLAPKTATNEYGNNNTKSAQTQQISNYTHARVINLLHDCTTTNAPVDWPHIHNECGFE